MKGRSAVQVAAYERELENLVRVLAAGPWTVQEIRDVLAAGKTKRPAAATVYARIEALASRGYAVRRQKRRKKVPGKSGHRERTYSVVKTVAKGKMWKTGKTGKTAKKERVA